MVILSPVNFLNNPKYIVVHHKILREKQDKAQNKPQGFQSNGKPSAKKLFVQTKLVIIPNTKYSKQKPDHYFHFAGCLPPYYPELSK